MVARRYLPLASQRIPDCSVTSWVFGTLFAFVALLINRRPSCHDFFVCLLGEFATALQIQRARAHPNCSYDRYVTAWDPVNKPVTVHVFLQAWLTGRAARMAPKAQEIPD